jgi:surfeit locus 1 family protein
MSYQFKPALPSTLFFFIVILVLLIAGSWQLFRANEKQHIEQLIDERKLETPLSLNMPFDEFSPYQIVQATGHYRANDSLLLDNIEYQGKSGYYLITPFEILASRAVIMVNRGWLPRSASDAQLPAFDTPKGLITLEGHLAPPYIKPESAQSLDQPISAMPPLWHYLDQQFFTQLYGYSVLPLVLNLKTGGQTSTLHSTLIPESSDDTPLLTDWPEHVASSDTHTAYAAQWFACALLALLAYLGISYKQTHKD